MRYEPTSTLLPVREYGTPTHVLSFSSYVIRSKNVESDMLSILYKKLGEKDANFRSIPSCYNNTSIKDVEGQCIQNR